MAVKSTATTDAIQSAHTVTIPQSGWTHLAYIKPDHIAGTGTDEEYSEMYVNNTPTFAAWHLWKSSGSTENAMGNVNSGGGTVFDNFFDISAAGVYAQYVALNDNTGNCITYVNGAHKTTATGVNAPGASTTGYFNQFHDDFGANSPLGTVSWDIWWNVVLTPPELAYLYQNGITGPCGYPFSVQYSQILVGWDFRSNYNDNGPAGRT